MADVSCENVTCVVCGAVGQYNEQDDGFRVCVECGTLAANVTNEVAEHTDPSALRLQSRRAGPAKHDLAGTNAHGSSRKRPRNHSPEVTTHTLIGAAPTPAVRDSSEGCLRVGTTLLSLQTKALASITGQVWLEPEVKLLWAKYIDCLINPPPPPLDHADPPTTPQTPQTDDPSVSATTTTPTTKPSPRRPVTLVPLDCTVALCCVALRLCRSPVLVPEVVGLCLAGRVPYYGAFDALEAHIRAGIGSEHYAYLRPPRILTNNALNAAVERVCAVLQIKALPPPNYLAVVRRYCRDMAVPPAVSDIALALVRIVPPSEWSTESTVYRLNSDPAHGASAVAVTAMAYLFAALKAVYGLDGITENAERGGAVPDTGLVQLPSVCEWLDRADDQRCSDRNRDMVCWSVAGRGTTTTHRECANRYKTPRPWQVVNSTYNAAATWAVGDVCGTSAYLNWCRDILVPESRRHSFRQRHCQQLHDLGRTMGEMVQRNAVADGLGVFAGAASVAALTAIFSDQLRSASVVLSTPATQVNHGGSCVDVPTYTRLVDGVSGQGSGHWPEALRAVGRTLASHILEGDPVLFEALHALELKVLGRVVVCEI